MTINLNPGLPQGDQPTEVSGNVTSKEALSLNFIRPGIVAAFNPGDAALAMTNPDVDAVVLEYLAPSQETLEVLRAGVKEWLDACTAPGHKVFTNEAHSVEGPALLNEEFLKIPEGPVREAMLQIVESLIEEYLILCDPAKVKLVACTFPILPDKVETFKEDGLLTHVPHFHQANPKDWPADQGVSPPTWHIDFPVIGAGMVVSHNDSNENILDANVISALEVHKQKLFQKEPFSEADILSELKEFWANGKFDPQSGAVIGMGTPVLMRYKDGDSFGTVHWRKISENHLEGPQAPSLNFVISGGKKIVSV